MSIIAFIFARGGSKGLPDKNIKILNGKPLIAWSIEHAKSVKRVDRVIVSTDSEEIARIAREYGAEVPFMRPAALATDNSPEWLSWQHSLKYLKNTDGCLPDLMLSIPTTAPLRNVKDIDKVIDEYKKRGGRQYIFDTFLDKSANMLNRFLTNRNSRSRRLIKSLYYKIK